MKDLLKAVCTIEGVQNGLGDAVGQGVFITPWHVLTARHCLANMKGRGLYFKNTDGVKTPRLKGAPIVTDKVHDLAVVRLAKPIGEECANFPKENETYTPRNRMAGGVRRSFTLVSRRLGHEQLMDVRPTEFKAQDAHGIVLEEMIVSDRVMQGHSGAPVIDENGHVFSVVSSIYHDPGDSKMAQVMACSFRSPPPFFTFLGPSQTAVRQIVKRALSLP